MAATNKSMAKAAFVLGIITMVSAVLMTAYPAYIFGGLSIICFILSRSRTGVVEHEATIGLILAVCGLVLNTVIVTWSVYTVFTNPDRFAEFNELFKQFYGMDFNTYIDEMKNAGMAM